MKYLLIDTATIFTHLAVGSQDQVFDHKSFISNAKQSDETLPLIIELLKKNNLSFQDLDVVFLGVGPGSFTGTRVGVAIGKTIGYSLNIPIIPFCSLCTFSPIETGPFAVITDAKNKKLYLQLGNKTDHALVFHDQPILVDKENLQDYEENYKIISPESISFEKPAFPAVADLSYVIKSSTDLFTKRMGVDPKNVEVLYLRYAKDL